MLALLMPTAALAQQTALYGPDGKVTGRATTTARPRRVTGRTATDSQGTTTIYDASGRKTGSVTQSGRK
jgi:YD repeat-containing protein